LFSTPFIIIQERYSLTEEDECSFVKAFAELAEGECSFVKAFAELAEGSNGIIFVKGALSVTQDQLSIYSIPRSAMGNNWY